MTIEFDEQTNRLTVAGLNEEVSLEVDQMRYFCGFRGVTKTSRRFVVVMRDYSEVFFSVHSEDAEKVEKILANFAESMSYAEYLKISRL